MLYICQDLAVLLVHFTVVQNEVGCRDDTTKIVDTRSHHKNEVRCRDDTNNIFITQGVGGTFAGAVSPPSV